MSDRKIGEAIFLSDIYCFVAGSLVAVELDVQASQELPVFVADFGQSLFNGNFLERWQFFLAVGRLLLEGDGRFEHEQDFVARGADALHRLVNFIRFLDSVVDRFAKLSNQFFQILVQTEPP